MLLFVYYLLPKESNIQWKMKFGDLGGQSERMCWASCDPHCILSDKLLLGFLIFFDTLLFVYYLLPKESNIQWKVKLGDLGG